MRLYQETNDNILSTVGSFKTSDKYQAIQSKDILNWFESRGFEYLGTSKAGVRDPLKEGYQKHLMAFTRDDLILDDGNKAQILALNSYDASTSLQLMAGVYRAACANGLIVGNDLYSERVVHIGNTQENVIHMMESIASKVGDLKETVKAMQGREVSFDESQELLRHAADIRLKRVNNLYNIDLSTIDRVRRSEDRSQDLYTVFNRIQESIIRGGVKYQTREVKTNKLGIEYNVTANRSTRAVKSIGQKVELNKALWERAEELIYA